MHIPILRIVTTRSAYLSFALRPGHLSHVAMDLPRRSPTLKSRTLHTGVKYSEVHRERVWDSTALRNSRADKKETEQRGIKQAEPEAACDRNVVSLPADNSCARSVSTLAGTLL